MTAQNETIIDLISLIEQRSPVRLIRKASTDGGEYWGNCPWCGGVDRFHVWPHSSSRPHYWCRGCNAKGDAIQFLKDYEGMSFMDACQELGIMPGDYSSYKGTLSPLGTSPAPCAAWQGTAEDFMYAAMKALHSKSGTAYREYLLARGITIETMLSKKIGYVPLKDARWIETPFEKWGLTEEMLTADQWAKGCVRIPDGLFFPHFGPDGKTWKLSMYRPLAQLLPEYKRGQIVGSKECLLNEDKISQDKPVIMTESFLDAISIEQAAGDVVTPVSTDGTKGCRSLRIQAVIQYAPYVLQSFDNDDAGHEGAKWWSVTIQNCIRWSTVPSNDVNEMLMSYDEVEVLAWVHNGIKNATGRITKPPAKNSSQDIVTTVTQEPDPTCVICSAIVAHYTDRGTPTCEKHYQGQQTIEQMMTALAQPPIPVSTDPLTQYAQTVDKIADIFAPCTITRDVPGYMLKDHVAFLTDKAERDRIAKEIAMRQLVRDRQYAKAYVTEEVFSE